MSDAADGAQPAVRSRSRSRSPVRRTEWSPPLGRILGERLRGTVAKWNDRGFGFIRIDSPEAESIFCHCSNIRDGNSLVINSEVEISVQYDVKRAKKRAVNVTGGIRTERRQFPANPEFGGKAGAEDVKSADSNSYHDLFRDRDRSRDRDHHRESRRPSSPPRRYEDHYEDRSFSPTARRFDRRDDYRSSSHLRDDSRYQQDFYHHRRYDDRYDDRLGGTPAPRYDDRLVPPPPLRYADRLFPPRFDDRLPPPRYDDRLYADRGGGGGYRDDYRRDDYYDHRPPPGNLREVVYDDRRPAYEGAVAVPDPRGAYHDYRHDYDHRPPPLPHYEDHRAPAFEDRRPYDDRAYDDRR